MDFAKCFCTPETVSIALSAGVFAAALVLYWLLMQLWRRFAGERPLAHRLIRRTRTPLLFIFLELAAFISLNFLPTEFAGGIRHTLYVLFIVTAGIFFIGIAGACYTNFTETKKITSRTHRAQLTQVLFLYRFLIFGIIAITCALVLLTFPYIKNVGLGILGSAGVAGIALGMAARPILLNLMSGFQIASSKMLQIGDMIAIEGEYGRIETINLTHIVLCTSDFRRIIIPIANFIDKPFENWDLTSSELLAVVYLYCDYSISLASMRRETQELLSKHPAWNGKSWSVTVSECGERAIQLKISASTNDYPACSELRNYLRETLIVFLQSECPQALPCIRQSNI